MSHNKDLLTYLHAAVCDNGC